MTTYTDEELRTIIKRRIDADKEVEDAIIDAIKWRRRHWLVNLVIDIARAVFGTVIAHIVESVVDWFYDNFAYN